MVKSIKLKKIKLTNSERLEEKKKRIIQSNPAPHANILNMEYKTAAPPICTIFGEKSKDLIEILIKRYTNKNITNFSAPITCCVSKSNRLSFYKIKNDMNDKIDASKIGDIVILTVLNELTTKLFEFITLLKSNGFPKVCVYIHSNENNKESKKNIKKIMNRLEEELFIGVKFFNNLEYNYLNKLTRYLSEVKIRPIEFKCNNPYLIVDNYKLNDKNISLMGYLRGSIINKEGKVHIPGIGDVNYNIEDILDDPCPLPEGRLLDMKKKIIYSPFNFITTNEIIKSKTDPLFNKENKEINIFEKEEEIKYKFTKIEKSDNLLKKNDLNKSILIEKPNLNEEIKPGKYLKIILNPITLENTCLKENKIKLINMLTPNYLIKRIETTILTLGFLLNTGNKHNIAIMKCKRNRFFRKLLKSNDPVILSVGWRRLQIIPIYYMQDSTSDPRRYLKVTPLNLHFYAAFYTPNIPLNSNCTLIRLDSTFQIAGSGKIEEIKEDNFSISKKLKLVGYPIEVHKNTAIIKDMFNSDLEVIKFTNSKIQTVSKIRGIVKKAVNKEGNFRAKFEGQIKISDIIFLNCLVPIFPIKGFINWNSKESINDNFKELEFMFLRLRKDIYEEESNKKEEKEYRTKRFEDYRILETPPIKDYRKLKVENKLAKNLPFDMKIQLNQMIKNKSLEIIPLEELDLEKSYKHLKEGEVIKSYEILSPEELEEKIIKEKKERKEYHENLRRKQDEELKDFIEEKLRIKKEGILKQNKNKRKYKD